MDTSTWLKARVAPRRFPGVMIVAIIATTLALVAIFSRGGDLSEFPNWRLALASLLGISWLYSLSLIAERHFQGSAKILFSLGIGLGTLGLYYWRLFSLELTELSLAFVLEYVGLMLASHFLAAYAPFIGRPAKRGFWEYNRRIFQRFLLALLFTGTLLLGVSLLLAALSRLFSAPWLAEFYLVVLALLLGIFNTWFFLAGVPENFDSLEENPPPYPPALRTFARWILLPLTLMIGFVLELWLLQRLFSSQTLDETSAIAFLSLGGFGLLTYLLLHPLEGEPKERLVKTFRYLFFIALLPLLIAVAYTAWHHIFRFGWTPPRYYGALISAWGLGLSLYLVLTRKPRLPWIPISLSLIFFITAAGPWSATALTRKSQERRLATVLGLPKNPGIPVSSAKLLTLSAQERETVERQVAYLENSDGCQDLLPYFGDLLRRRMGEEVDCSTQDLFTLLRRDPSLPAQDLSLPIVNINFTQSESRGSVSTLGYDFYYPSSAIQFLNPDQAFADCFPSPEKTELCVRHVSGKFVVELFRQGRSLATIDLEPWLRGLVEKNLKDPAQGDFDPRYRDFKLPAADMTLETTVGKVKIRLPFEHIRFEMRGDVLSPEALRFSLLFQEGT